MMKPKTILHSFCFFTLSIVAMFITCTQKADAQKTTADTWIGVSDSAWENVANWSCGTLPDNNTDVIINSAVPNPPKVSSNVLCRSLTLNAGAILKVKTGYKLNITGKEQ